MEKITGVTTNKTEHWTDIKVKEGSEEKEQLRFDTKKYQKIEGFGGCFNELGWDALSKLDHKKQDKIIKELFDPEKGCKFNFCRLPIGASDFALKWYSHNENNEDYQMNNFSIERDKKYLIPYIKKAQKLVPDLKFSASPWSPPTWMKDPAVYNHGTLRQEEKVLKAYALYFVRFIQEYQKEGIKIDQIHVQNEPAADQKFPSCVWTGEEIRDFIRDYLGPAFEKHNVDCEIWLGTINSSSYNDYANTVLNDEKARKYISGVGYQWDGKFAVQRTNIAWPDMKLMQTENECGDGRNTWGYARYVFDLLWHYLSNGVSIYMYWNMILQKGGLSTWGWNQNSLICIDPETKEVEYNYEFYLMKHFSHFIEKNARLRGLTGNLSGNALGFENPDGSLILIIHNPFKEKKELNVSAEGKNFTVLLKPDSFNTIKLK